MRFRQLTAYLGSGDRADGSEKKPYKTLKRALEGLRKIRWTGLNHGRLCCELGFTISKTPSPSTPMTRELHCRAITGRKRQYLAEP
eukprot:448818-Amorphochlora_amoeboformis.AAC.1